MEILTKNKNLKRIDLLNYEGPVLSCVKKKKIFVVQDQWKNVVDILSLKDLYRFLIGKNIITDSKGNKWSYFEASESAKPDQKVLFKFLHE